MNNFDLAKIYLTKEIITDIPIQLCKILIAYGKSLVQVKFSQLRFRHAPKIHLHDLICQSGFVNPVDHTLKHEPGNQTDQNCLAAFE